MDSELLTARADVVLDRPERWAKQLVSHLGNKVTVEANPEGGDTLFIGTGRGIVRAETNTVVLIAEAPDADTLANVQDVLGRHLARFAAKEEPDVTWVVASSE